MVGTRIDGHILGHRRNFRLAEIVTTSEEWSVTSYYAILCVCKFLIDLALIKSFLNTET